MAQQAELMPPQSEAVASKPIAGEALVLMLERLAKDPSVDVVKLERLIEMQKDILRFQAKAEFEAAFAEMQGELPIVDERGRIVVGNETRSTFGRHEDIQEAVKPILRKHGFSVRHKNRKLENGGLLIIGILSHRAGHSEEDEFECPADTSGSKNGIQALGSTREYGRRYTTIALLNIVTRRVDDDGQSAGRPAPPDGYDNFVLDLETLAEEGSRGIGKAYKAASEEFRAYAERHDRARWKDIRAKAKKADEAREEAQP